MRDIDLYNVDIEGDEALENIKRAIVELRRDFYAHNHDGVNSLQFQAIMAEAFSARTIVTKTSGARIKMEGNDLYLYDDTTGGTNPPTGDSASIYFLRTDDITETKKFIIRRRAGKNNDSENVIEAFFESSAEGTVLIDSYSESNQDQNFTLYSGSTTFRGQSFLNSSAIKLGTCKFYLKKTGSPTGNIRAKLYSHSGTFGSTGIPNGLALATSDAVDISTLTTSSALVTFSFSNSNQINLSASTHYIIVVTYSGGDSNNYLNVGYDNSSPSHAGNVSYSSNGSTWDSGTGDLCFYIYTASQRNYIFLGRNGLADASNYTDFVVMHGIDSVRAEINRVHSYHSRPNIYAADYNKIDSTKTGVISWIAGEGKDGLAGLAFLIEYLVFSNSPSFAVGDTITGNSTGATGKILYKIDANNYYISHTSYGVDFTTADNACTTDGAGGGSGTGALSSTVFATANQLYIDDSLNVRLGINMIPDADNSYDIGSATKNIKDIYLTGEIIGGNVINYFGDGSDGDVTISVDTTLSADKFYNNLTINTGVTLNPGGYRIFVKGTVTINGTGKIARNGNNGTNASGSTGGTGATALAAGTIAGGAAGGNGANGRTNNGDGNNGSDGGASSPSIGVSGVAGGNGGGIQGSYAGGNGGGGGTFTSEDLNFETNYKIQSTDVVITPNILQNAITTITVSIVKGTTSSYTLSASSGSGGGGSGGFINATGGYSGAGGGGGGSGGIVLIVANSIVNNGTIEAKGGNGGNGSNATGPDSSSAAGEGAGGGGGSGGSVILVYNSYSGSGSISVAGGTKGTNGNYWLYGGSFTMISGTQAANGSTGDIFRLILP